MKRKETSSVHNKCQWSHSIITLARRYKKSTCCIRTGYQAIYSIHHSLETHNLQPLRLWRYPLSSQQRPPKTYHFPTFHTLKHTTCRLSSVTYSCTSPPAYTSITAILPSLPPASAVPSAYHRSPSTMHLPPSPGQQLHFQTPVSVRLTQRNIVERILSAQRRARDYVLLVLRRGRKRGGERCR